MATSVSPRSSLGVQPCSVFGFAVSGSGSASVPSQIFESGFAANIIHLRPDEQATANWGFDGVDALRAPDRPRGIDRGGKIGQKALLPPLFVVSRPPASPASHPCRLPCASALPVSAP